MNLACLYGVNCRSDFPLFAATTVPGNDSGFLTLEVGEGLEFAAQEGAAQPLFSTHGRDLDIWTDKPEWGPIDPGQPWCIRVKGVVSFYWQSGVKKIGYKLHDQGNNERVAFWFVHIVLPLYLTLERGYNFIHAAALELDQAAILLLAPSTGGKSTLGDYFLKQGHAMLSDDKVLISKEEGHFLAVPSHPYHRPYRRFEELGQQVARACEESRPIAAFYLLEAGGADSNICFSEVTGFTKFEKLSYNYLYPLSFLQRERLHYLGSMVNATQVYKVSRPWNLDRMHEVYEAICSHAQSYRISESDSGLQI